jgi:integrase/recombinase XerD
MFETVFTRKGAERHRRAPLLREREAFLAYLQRRGTGRSCLKIYSSRLNQIVRFLKLKKLRRVRMSEIKAAARRWASYRGQYRHSPAGPYSEPSFVWLARRWLKFHGKLIVPQRRFWSTEELAQYAAALREQKFSSVTIHGRVAHTRRFLEWCAKRLHKRQLSALSVRDIDKYFSEMASRWGTVTIATCATALRPFFLYAESCGWCPKIALGIKAPTRHLGSSLPAGPKWVEVLRLLRSTKGRTPVTIRARAILLLVCLYGLRRGEVIRLQLSDFDWPNGVFTVRRSKLGGLQQFPLRREVSNAILRYIRHARPPLSSCNHVFVSFHPPFGPMNPSSVYEIVSYRLRHLRIKAPRRGPHALRHACATELLRRGTPLRDIADFLGHRNCRSVTIYAKFDLQALRKVSDIDLTARL